MKRSHNDDGQNGPRGNGNALSLGGGGGSGGGGGGGGGGNGGNNGGAGGGNKRFRHNDENIRLLIPSRVSINAN